MTSLHVLVLAISRRPINLHVSTSRQYSSKLELAEANQPFSLVGENNPWPMCCSKLLFVTLASAVNALLRALGLPDEFVKSEKFLADLSTMKSWDT